MENMQEAINMLKKGRHSACKLNTYVQGAQNELLVEEIMGSLSRAITKLETQNQKKDPCAKQKNVKGHTAKKTGNRRRIDAESCNKIVGETSEDSYIWRKYGQKEINGLKYPRCYYRCTHKDDQNCQATKQVQQSTINPLKYEIFYFGKHTCTNLYYNQQQDPEINPSFEINFSSSNSETRSDQSSAFSYSSSISSDPMWREPSVANCVASESVQSSTGSLMTLTDLDEELMNIDVSSYYVDQFDFGPYQPTI
ncbi:hypothetical protein LUZ60_011034 [Juncus effusus]|nr:hypothetical protein LUZ60_011034 [Juncus effusus]